MSKTQASTAKISQAAIDQAIASTNEILELLGEYLLDNLVHNANLTDDLVLALVAYLGEPSKGNRKAVCEMAYKANAGSSIWTTFQKFRNSASFCSLHARCEQELIEAAIAVAKPASKPVKAEVVEVKATQVEVLPNDLERIASTIIKDTTGVVTMNDIDQVIHLFNEFGYKSHPVMLELKSIRSKRESPKQSPVVKETPNKVTQASARNLEQVKAAAAKQAAKAKEDAEKAAAKAAEAADLAKEQVKEMVQLPVIPSVEALEAMSRKELVAAMKRINYNYKTDIPTNGKSEEIKKQLAQYVLGISGYKSPTATKTAPKLPMPAIATMKDIQTLDRKALIKAVQALKSNDPSITTRANSSSLTLQQLLSEKILKTSYVEVAKVGKGGKGKKSSEPLPFPEDLSIDKVRDASYRELQALGRILRSRGIEPGRLNAKADVLREAVSRGLAQAGFNIATATIPQPSDDVALLGKYLEKRAA